MADPRQVISYASPPPPARQRTHPIVWWFVVDGALFFVGFVILMGAYHDLPMDQSPPAAVDALITVAMLSSLGLFVVLVGWLIVSKLRRPGRAVRSL